MKAKYVTPEQFAKLSKGKKVKSYPNPLVKEIADVTYKIVTPDTVCKISRLTEEQYIWWLGMSKETYSRGLKEYKSDSNAEVYELTVVGDWFPTDLIAGTVSCNLGYGVTRNAFSMNTPLSDKTGYLQANGSIGSASCLFMGSKVNEAIKILNKNHFNFKMI